MNPLGNRARAEELARLLEGAVAGPASSTAALAALGARLRAVAPALEDTHAMRPEIKVALRQRLLAVAAVQDAATPVPASARSLERAVSWTRSWKGQRRIAALSGAMAFVVALAGVGVASSKSLPGQPFYGVKRAAEALQLDLAGNDTARGTKHLEFASTRLREVRALAYGEGQLSLGTAGAQAAGGTLSSSLRQRITETLEDFDSSTKRGRDLLEGVYRRTGKQAPLRILTTFSTQQSKRLATIIPALPAGTANAAQESLTLVTEIGDDAEQLLEMGSCGTDCDPGNGGPTLPVEPGPTPTATESGTASPGTEPDNNGVPPCACPEPSPTPEPTPAPSPSPSPSPSESPTPSPSPSPTSSPSPTLLPIPLPTILPTILPTLPPLPVPLPTILPTLLPDAVTKP